MQSHACIYKYTYICMYIHFFLEQTFVCKNLTSLVRKNTTAKSSRLWYTCYSPLRSLTMYMYTHEEGTLILAIKYIRIF